MKQTYESYKQAIINDAIERETCEISEFVGKFYCRYNKAGNLSLSTAEVEIYISKNHINAPFNLRNVFFRAQHLKQFIREFDGEEVASISGYIIKLKAMRPLFEECLKKEMIPIWESWKANGNQTFMKSTKAENQGFYKFINKLEE